jgi:hypothetical protein
MPDHSPALLEVLASDRTLLVRTEYSDDDGWTELRRLVEAPYEDGFRAYLAFVEDPSLTNKPLDELMALIDTAGYRSFFFVADQAAIQGPEHAVLVVDLVEQRGRTFRVIPSQMWAVENNLSIANMDLSEFANSTDESGVFRGFSE